MAYKRLLVAIDLGSQSPQIALKAATMARTQQAEIHLLHIVEPLSLALGSEMPLDTSSLQEEISQQSETAINELAQSLNIPVNHCYVATGRLDKTIASIASEIGADLIVIGSHARWGLDLVFGTTTDGVLHAASCDVLAIRVDREN